MGIYGLNLILTSKCSKKTCKGAKTSNQIHQKLIEKKAFARQKLKEF